MGMFRNIADLFGGRSKVDSVTVETFEELSNFLRNQVTTLDRVGLCVHINEITVGYISHLVMMITKKPVSFGEVQQTMRRLFPDKSSMIMIDNAFQVFFGDSQTEEKLAALFPIAKKEYEAGSGEFLIRHSKKAREDIEAMFSGGANFDPRETPSWTANDLA